MPGHFRNLFQAFLTINFRFTLVHCTARSHWPLQDPKAIIPSTNISLNPPISPLTQTKSHGQQLSPLLLRSLYHFSALLLLFGWLAQSESRFPVSNCHCVGWLGLTFLSTKQRHSSLHHDLLSGPGKLASPCRPSRLLPPCDPYVFHIYLG